MEVCGEAVDGQDAIDKAKEIVPDLVIMDISMPRLNGLEATSEIRRTLPQTDVVILSQHDSPEMMQQALNMGARGYVVKTAVGRDLLKSIDKLRDGELNFFSPADVGANSNLDIQEILQRSQAFEKALRQNEGRFRAIVDATPECVKPVASDGTLIHVNAAGLEMIDANSLEAVVGKSVYDMLVPEDRERFRVFLETICRGEKGPLEFEITDLRGIRRQMETRAVPLLQPNGKIFQLAVTSDVTSNRSAERTTALLAAIVDSSDDAIVSKNLDGVITSWNKGAERVFGYTAEEAVGRSIILIIPPDRRDEETEILTRLRRGERMDYFETVRKRKDGKLINVSVTISPVKDSKGRVIGASKVARDITERKQAEEMLGASENRLRILTESLDLEVRARTEELEQRNADVLRQSEQLREISWKLLSIQDDERRHIARELHDSAGQLLTVLAMNLAAIVRNAREKAPEFAESVEEARELVRQLTNEIRTTSYLLHPPLLDDEGLEAAISWYVRGVAERSGLEIDFRISESFGRLPSDMELAVFRVVQECLTNIHRHSGSKRASIEIFRDAEQVSVEVRDYGKGISREKLAEIQSKGSGVGIRGMRERLRQFNGDVTIDSDGGGTTFRVSISVSQNGSAIEESKTQIA